MRRDPAQLVSNSVQLRSKVADWVCLTVFVAVFLSVCIHFGAQGVFWVHFGSPGGFQGSILGALEVSWAPFWGLLGCILSALGVYWALLGALGAHKVPHCRPWSPSGAYLEIKISLKSETVLNCFLLLFYVIWGECWELF